MPSVVIIHAAEDALPARALAEKIRQAELEVQVELGGEALRDAIRRAAVTVALWSPRAVAKPGLVEDAFYAASANTLIHATMQNAPAPAEFAQDKPVNLTGWRGEAEFAPWRQLAERITQAAGVASLPPPAQRPASGFFQPGANPANALQRRRRAAPLQAGPADAAYAPPQRSAPPPPPRPAASTPANDAPPHFPQEQKRGPGMMLAIAAIGIIAIGGGGFFWTQMQGSQTATNWESVERDDAGALRAFLAGNPGQFRDEAREALRELEQRQFETARRANSIEAMEAFLADFPDSEHAIAARGRIAELRSLPSDLTPLTPSDEAIDPEALLQPVDPDLAASGTTPETAGGGPVPLAPPQPEEPVLQEPGLEPELPEPDTAPGT